MYTYTNYKTKKALREAFASGVKIHVFQPNAVSSVSLNGSAVIEGPHYPEPHRWYAGVTLKDGVITEIRS